MEECEQQAHESLLYWREDKGLQIPAFLCGEQELFGPQFCVSIWAEECEASEDTSNVTCLGFAEDEKGKREILCD